MVHLIALCAGVVWLFGGLVFASSKAAGRKCSGYHGEVMSCDKG
jgi:hypothetical protein